LTTPYNLAVLHARVQLLLLHESLSEVVCSPVPSFCASGPLRTKLQCPISPSFGRCRCEFVCDPWTLLSGFAAAEDVCIIIELINFKAWRSFCHSYAVRKSCITSYLALFLVCTVAYASLFCLSHCSWRAARVNHVDVSSVNSSTCCVRTSTADNAYVL
jgi:hypothetical protein